MVCSAAAPTLKRAATPPVGLACCTGLRTGWCAARGVSCWAVEAWEWLGAADLCGADVFLGFLEGAAFFTAGILVVFFVVAGALAAFLVVDFFTDLAAAACFGLAALTAFAAGLRTTFPAGLRAGFATAFFAGLALADLAADFACLPLRLAAPCFGFAMSLHSRLWRCDRVL